MKRQYETILIERKDGVMHLLLNRPLAVNALNSTCLIELRVALRDFQREHRSRLIMISGASNRVFCGGADVREVADLVKAHNKHALRRFSRSLEELFYQVEHLSKITVAAVNGPAVGAGAELALACDIRLFSSKSYLAFPEVQLGLVPPTNRLRSLCGNSAALQFAYTGRKITAQRAKQMGLALEVLPARKFLNRASQLALSFSKFSARAISTTKKSGSRDREVDPAYHSDELFFAKTFRDAISSFS